MVLICTNPITCENSDIVSVWVDIISLVANIIIGLVIVFVIQDKLANKRVLKDHFIQEVKQIKSDYNEMFIKLHNGDLDPMYVRNWLKSSNIQINQLMSLINLKYKLRKNMLSPFQIELNKVLTDLNEYIASFQGNSKIILTNASMLQLHKFRQKNDNLFNELIIEINDSNY